MSLADFFQVSALRLVFWVTNLKFMNKKTVLVALLFGVGTSMQAQQTEETQIEEVSLVSKTPQNINKVGKNVTLITAADLENYKGQNLNDVLDQVAGIQITGNFNNMTEPKILAVMNGFQQRSSQNNDAKSYLSKPFQRLTKYKALITPILDKTNR